MRLICGINDRRVGALTDLGAGRIGFSYDEGWYADWVRGAAHPISLSLRPSSPDEVLDATAYVAGLLPDSPHHRDMLARELDLGDSPTDFELISRIGRDSAGALTITPEGDTGRGPKAPSVEWLTEAGLAEHLRSLPRRPLLIDDEHGVMLSLAGVNDKAAVVVSRGRIGLPRHGAPSTHIIKVDIPRLTGSVLTEHFCLRLAKAAGLRVPHSRIHRAEDQAFMLMARYDRVLTQTGVTRVHQEDFCQALGLPPARKYERRGGPGWAECLSLAANTSHPAAARDEMVRWAALQFLIGNPDAHSKNYSLLYDPGSSGVRLAPLYDLNNGPAFRASFRSVSPKMAMSIGDQADPERVGPQEWARFSQTSGLDPRVVASAVAETASRLLAALPIAQAECPGCEAVSLAAEDVRARCEAWVGIDHAGPELG